MHMGFCRRKPDAGKLARSGRKAVRTADSGEIGSPGCAQRHAIAQVHTSPSPVFGLGTSEPDYATRFIADTPK
jgi:hypothetical protein